MDAYIAWGHGTQTNGLPDSGCCFQNVSEAELTGPIARTLTQTLRQHGLTVGSDTDSGNDKNMTVTVQEANRACANLYVSVHCDFYKAPSGTYPICHPGSSEGYQLAACINQAVLSRIPISTRGILRRADYEVTATHMPAVIFETGSIQADLQLLKSHAVPYGQAMAAGILDYLNRPYHETDASLDILATQAQPLFKPPLLLQYGDFGAAVEQLQRDLRAMAYEDASGNTLIIDRCFGRATEYAVKRLQSFHHLAVDGIYGSLSDQALMQEIKAVQKALIQKGYPLDADGAVGPKTDRALRDFQTQKGLVPDGIAGSLTLSALGIR